MFVFPEDTKNMPTQQFNENECFESNVEEDIAITSICGKCSVLNLRDYQSCRPTELDEKDVYLCSATYNEDELRFRRNIRGCKRLQLPQNIRDDEYWYFDQPYNPRHRPSMWLIPGEEFTKKNDAEPTGDENDHLQIDMDKIGFTLFKKELVSSIMRATPNIPVTELGRISEEKWKGLTEDQQKEFKDRAKRQGLGDHLYIYQCWWANCEHQYEDLKDLMIHVIEGPHLVRCPETGIFPCKWKECERQKNGLKSLKTHSQLVRHIREIHFKAARQTKIVAGDKSKFFFPAHQACEDFRDGSETSSRASVTSPLSPRVPPPNGHQFPPNFTNMPNSPGAPMVGGNMMQNQAGLYPPFRMNGQAPATAAILMQQQIFQQQQLLIHAARRSMVPNQVTRTPVPTTPNGNPLLVPQPQTPQGVAQPPQQQITPQMPPQINGQPHGLTPEQQQMLLVQVQQQHHQIMKLQEQVKSLNNNVTQQQQQPPPPPPVQQPAKPPTPVAEKTPVFVAPPTSNATKLRHSEAYLRYIEGLRDNQNKLSNWGELANAQNKPKPPTGQLPVHWLGTNNGFQSTTDALWELRDHMLRDSITLSKYT